MLLIPLSVMSGCDQKPEPAPAPERIAIVTFRPGNLDIFYREARGQALRRLVDDPARDEDPVLSPDGRWVVFCSERRGHPDLWILDLRAPGPPRLLLDSDAMEDQPAFSPDGGRIAFVGTAEGNADIYVAPFRPETTIRMDAATNLTRSPGGDFRPAFSPDGVRIAFSSDRDSPATGPSVARSRKGDVYVMAADGSSLRRLTRSGEWNGSPAWLPDGTTIVFSAARIDLDAHVTGKGGITARLMKIAVDDPDGAPLALTPDGVTALSPAPMPDGRIAYSRREGPFVPTRGWSIASLDGDGRDSRSETSAGESCWGSSFGFASEAMVCTGAGEAGSGPATSFGQVLGMGTLLEPHAPSILTLPDRALALYPLRTVAAAVHPSDDLVAHTESPADADLNRPESFETRLVLSAPDGGGARVLHRFGRGQDPTVPLAWSPDGSWLAFTVGAIFAPPDASADVWRIGREGQMAAIEVTPASPGNDGFPDISGGESKIVFRSGRTGNNEIFLASADGSAPRNLTLHPANDTFPAISPRGDLVAFCSDRDGDADPVTGRRTFEIYVLDIRPDGAPGAPRRLTRSPGQDAHPRFSPDGTWIVYTSERGGMNDEEPLVKSLLFAPQAYGDIYAQRLRDDLIVRLTHNKWEDGTPTWAGAISARSHR